MGHTSDRGSENVELDGTHDDAPEGWVWRWEIAGPDWSPWPRSTGRCRYAVGGGVTCKRPAVASLNRKYNKPPATGRNGWWDYCGDHLYGRVLVDFDGLPAVLQQVLRPAEGTPDDMAEVARRLSEFGRRPE